jgi:hypothetical protein
MTPGGKPHAVTDKREHCNESQASGLSYMPLRRDFVIDPELRVRGEPRGSISSSPQTQRTIRTLNEAIDFLREHKTGRNLADRERVIRLLEGARSPAEMLDAANAFRAWLQTEDLLFPADRESGR